MFVYALFYNLPTSEFEENKNTNPSSPWKPQEITLSEAAAEISKTDLVMEERPFMVYDHIWIRSDQMSFLLTPYYNNLLMLEVTGLGLARKWSMMNGPCIFFNPDGTPAFEYTKHEMLNVTRIWEGIAAYRDPKEIAGQDFG